MFILPNGARRSPDVGWIKLERRDALILKEKQGFPTIVPDFVIQLVNPSDLKNRRYSDFQLETVPKEIIITNFVRWAKFPRMTLV